ncbi:MAG: ribonuclease E/G [Alphaproteobacteria bacterium]|nr:ribonuclease E/G [Alphaproteobacteria bacterium]
MSKQMLIDATHPEETRVVILDEGRLDELDVDTANKKQIKGNIYLAKVVRVEPSLQAAFVEYGGNRHGFLAFGEIHPDYYQIPVDDREALKKEMATETDSDETEENDTDVENVSENDEVVRVRPSFYKKYRIQEVIHPGQVMLVQAVKEERGNKGAAMTTYLSLAGRFCVLMPNNSRGGGVSRKIANAQDRKDLREIVDKLSIPEGMSVIVRTAGQGKTKTDIKRDFDYLIKTWSQIRELTLKSIAPKLIHEEGDIIKRSLRDVFTTDIDEIIVEGENSFKTTKALVKSLMPAQVKKVKEYKGKVPLFCQYQVEAQLEQIHNHIARLPSGGYIVIDQTEALVAVDVNSGRSTREHSIEETALQTNLETCEELARQLRLRDLAGLVVIDFIDMDEPKNNAAVERHLKEALKRDRARIQVGRMSGFGLIEMTRQRLHSSFLESSYKPCPHCGGLGVVRSVESSAMHALRLLEEAAIKNTRTQLMLSVTPEVAEYLSNNKRVHLLELEKNYQVGIQVISDETLQRVDDFKLERIREDGNKVAVNNEGAPLPHGPKVDLAALGDEIVIGDDVKGRRGRRHRDWRHRRNKDKQNNAENVAEPTSEENFKVVEQAPLAEVEKDQAEQKKDNRRSRGKKQEDKPTEEKPVSTEEAKPAKKGWWNRLVS